MQDDLPHAMGPTTPLELSRACAAWWREDAAMTDAYMQVLVAIARRSA